MARLRRPDPAPARRRPIRTPVRTTALVVAGVLGAAGALVGGPVRAAGLVTSPRDVSSATWTSPGYWVASASGAVAARGAAGYFGSAAPGAGARLRSPIVGLAATPDGQGYWLASASGGIFAYGDAGFHGSAARAQLRSPIVGLAATPSGQGYWEVAGDGTVFSFGDARGHGSPGGARRPAITGLTPTPSGHGYWLVAANGAAYPFGDAGGYGSAAGRHLPSRVVAMAAAPDGHGYLLAAHGGGVYGFGDESAQGGGFGGVVAVAAAPPHPPARTAVFYYPWYASLSTDGEWRHWNQNGHTPPYDIGSDYYPVRGAYSSSDAAVVDAQMAEIAAAGVDEVIVSWWGRGSFEDEKIPLVEQLAAAHGLSVAIQIEPYKGRTAASVGQDIVYLEASYGVSQFFVYRAQDFPAGDWAPVLGLVPDATVWAESFSDGLEAGWVQTFAVQAGFSGIYTYDPYDIHGPQMAEICGAARQDHLLCSPSVAPGFSAVRATGQPTVRSRQGGATYDSMWQGAIDSDPDLVTITSYNEWHEGSQIEPAMPFCPTSTFCYANYNGAYGLSGPAAEDAYLGRTLGWVHNYQARESP